MVIITFFFVNFVDATGTLSHGTHDRMNLNCI